MVKPAGRALLSKISVPGGLVLPSRAPAFLAKEERERDPQKVAVRNSNLQ